MEGLGQFGVGVQGFEEVVGEVEGRLLPWGEEALFGVGHRLPKVGADGGFVPGNLARRAEAEDACVAGVGAVLFQHARGVLQQGWVEEAEAQVVPERAEEGDVAACVHVAGVAPFRGLAQPQVVADAAEVGEVGGPAAGDAGGGRVPGAASAAVEKVVVGVEDHGGGEVGRSERLSFESVLCWP